MPAHGARGRNAAAGNALPASAARGFPQKVASSANLQNPAAKGCASVRATYARNTVSERSRDKTRTRPHPRLQRSAGRSKRNPFMDFTSKQTVLIRKIQRQRHPSASGDKEPTPTLPYPEITVIPQWQCLRWFSSFIVSNPAKSHKRLMAHATLLSSGAEMETDSGINLIPSPKGVAFCPITVKIVITWGNKTIKTPELHVPP